MKSSPSEFAHSNKRLFLSSSVKLCVYSFEPIPESLKDKILPTLPVTDGKSFAFSITPLNVNGVVSCSSVTIFASIHFGRFSELIVTSLYPLPISRTASAKAPKASFPRMLSFLRFSSSIMFSTDKFLVFTVSASTLFNVAFSDVMFVTAASVASIFVDLKSSVSMFVDVSFPIVASAPSALPNLRFSMSASTFTLMLPVSMFSDFKFLIVPLSDSIVPVVIDSS